MRVIKYLVSFSLLVLGVGLETAVSENLSTKTEVTLPEVVVSEGQDKNPVIATSGSTATKTDTPLLEIPRSVSVVTEERMEEQGTNTVQDALLYSSGVYGATYGYDTRGDWSLVRGSEPVQFVDGLKSLFGYYNNTRPNPYSLSRIEILKGPSSVLYGQGTTGGTLNLLSKLPQEKSKNQLYVEYGSFERMEMGTDLTGRIDPDGEFLYRFVGVLRRSDTQVDHVEDDSVVGAPSFTWQPNDNTKLTLLANLQNNETGTATQFLPWAGTVFPGPNGRIPTSAFLSEPDWDRYDTKQRAVTALFEHRFDQTWSVDARARYTHSNSNYYSMWPDFPPTFLEDGRSVSRTLYIAQKEADAFVSDVRLVSEFATGMLDHQLGFGFDYQNSKLNEDSYYGYGEGGIIDVYNPVYGNIPDPALTPLTSVPEATTNQIGFYLLDQIRIGEPWIVTLGVRADEAKSETDDEQPSQTDSQVTKSLGLMHVFENGIAPYVSYAESFDPVIGTNLAGENFDPLEGEQYEVGVKFQPKSLPAIFTLSAFDLTEKNRLTSDPTNPVESVQTGEVNIQGIELESQFQLGDLEVLASYSILDDEISESNDGDEGFHVASVPEQLAASWVTYKPVKQLPGFKVGAGVRYVGASWDGADTIKTPSYTLFDAMLGYQLGDWELALNARNLEDETHETTCLARGDCFYGERRTVALNVSYNF